MGICSFGHKPTVIIPTQLSSDLQDERKTALRLKLWNMKRIDDAPALSIGTSKMYQMRKCRQEQPRPHTTSLESEVQSPQ